MAMSLRVNSIRWLWAHDAAQGCVRFWENVYEVYYSRPIQVLITGSTHVWHTTRKITVLL